MRRNIDRRDFVRQGAAAAMGLAAAPGFLDAAPALTRRARPVVVASANGHAFRNGGPHTAVETAFRALTANADALDAILDGVTINELDPGDTSVGYGGLPNGDGVVQLDASCMHGPTRRAGAVAALEGVRTPSLVARAVMDRTDHHLLVGRDAQVFARNMGFAIEPDLNSDESRRLWLEWKRRVDPSRWPDPRDRAEAGYRAGLDMLAEGLMRPDSFHGTIHCSALGPSGHIAGLTTTSGLAWKIPGRVGDSPILGAGLYVDGEVGAAGSTGRGEANLYNLTSFLIVENMRRGMTPKDAALDGLRRVVRNTMEPRLLNGRGLPAFNLQFYVLNARGEHAGASLYAADYAVCTENGAEVLPCEAMYEGAARA